MASQADPTEEHPVRIIVDNVTGAVSVRIRWNWRRTIGVAGLPAATLAALSMVAQQHMQAARETTPPDFRPLEQSLPESHTDRVSLIGRAIRDLDEFRLALADLPTSECRVQDPAQRVTVTIRQNDISQIDFDDQWIDQAGDTAVELALSSALSAALRQLTSRPVRALDGCPDLRKLLQASGSPLIAASGGEHR